MEWSEFEQLLGRLSVQFASMDYAATQVLCYLIAGEDLVVSATLTENMPFARKLDLIKDLAAWRLARHLEVKTALDEWLSTTKKYREREEPVHTWAVASR